MTQPTEGGSYTCHPDTGKLTQVEKPTAPAMPVEKPEPETPATEQPTTAAQKRK